MLLTLITQRFHLSGQGFDERFEGLYVGSFSPSGAPSGSGVIPVLGIVRRDGTFITVTGADGEVLGAKSSPFFASWVRTGPRSIKVVAMNQLSSRDGGAGRNLKVEDNRRVLSRFRSPAGCAPARDLSLQPLRRLSVLHLSRSTDCHWNARTDF